MDSLQYRVRSPVETAKYHGGVRPSDRYQAIVVHSTAGHSSKESLSWLNRVLKNGEGKASYNYVIDRDGTIWRFLPANIVAYHAGRSAWPGVTSQFGSINVSSIGIALDDENAVGDTLPDIQLESLFWLCVTFCRQYRIDPSKIISHRECALPAGRKDDPLPSILDMPAWRERVVMELARG